MTEYDLGRAFASDDEPSDRFDRGDTEVTPADADPGDLEFPGFQVVADQEVMLEPVLLKARAGNGVTS